MSRDTRIVRRRIGGRLVPNSIPPLSTLGTSAEYYDDDAKAMMLSVDGGAYAPYATGSTAGVLQQVADFNLAADVITTALSPVYTTLLTGSITTTLAASFLQIQHYNTVIFLGGAASTRTCTIRLRLNGVLLPISRTSTQNAQTTSQIMNLNILRRVPIVAGLQTVIVEWTRFGGGVGNTMNCRPATLPDLEGAFLQLQEHAP